MTSTDVGPAGPEDPRPVTPTGPIDATVTIPGSKSITNRALICAALARGSSELSGALDSDDTMAMQRCLRALGVPVRPGEGDMVLIGSGGISDVSLTLFAQQSGTTSRFLLPLMALDAVTRRLDGDPQLRARPMGPTLEVLRSLGVLIHEESEPGHLPLAIRGPIRGHRAVMSGDVSSQFVSGLLLSAPRVPDGLRIEIEGPLVSRPYVDMTVRVMEAFGAEVYADGAAWDVSGTGYDGARYRIEPDASAASYAFAAAVLTGGRVTVPGLHRNALQGDVGFADVLEQMGATVHWHSDGVTVSAGERLVGIDVDMSQISDTAQTLAVVATAAETPTRMRGIGFIRRKETDRVAAMATELARCGIRVEESEDELVIHPGPIGPADIETYDDHRMAMSFALLGLVHPGIRIQDPGCVAKTYPGYWDMLDGLATRSWPAAHTV